MHLPLGPISFIFMQFAAKILSKNRFFPKLRGWYPHLGNDVSATEICTWVWVLLIVLSRLYQLVVVLLVDFIRYVLVSTVVVLWLEWSGWRCLVTVCLEIQWTQRVGWRATGSLEKFTAVPLHTCEYACLKKACTWHFHFPELSEVISKQEHHL